MATQTRCSRINDLCKPITVNIMTPSHEPSSVIVIKTIKYILYQRQQIPFTYEFLMDLALKGKAVLNDSKIKEGAGRGVHFRDVRTQWKKYQKIVESFEMLEEIFKNVRQELDQCNNHLVPEVMIVLGSTPMSPKEVYRIILPQHSRISSTSDIAPKTNIFHMFRGIMTCEELQNFVTKSLSTTNTYLFVKKRAGLNSPWLLPKRLYEPPNMGQHIIFSLKGSTSEEQSISSNVDNDTGQEAEIYPDCALVTEDSEEQFRLPYNEGHNPLHRNSYVSHDLKKNSVDKNFDDMHWYQAKHVFRGFVNEMQF
ncbi:MAD2L1-binding protein isoform X1 [Schistocerca americana]|uniref:MAD2L1-binding protein isoform X1 n=1 Tax=Schistocerca americana TaxID=7009 RepID=UPI001F502CD3|nr:MAD2L1-binding protein isoform X1 [Schistocerca americana]